MKLAIVLFSLSLTAHAAGLDGRWTAQTVAHGKKAADQPVTFTLDLKTQDGKVTGAVILDGGKKLRSQTIENGKVEGSKITFSTHPQSKKKSKNAAASFQWTAVLNGDQLTGTRTKDAAKHGQQFTAKRAN